MVLRDEQGELLSKGKSAQVKKLKRASKGVRTAWDDKQVITGKQSKLKLKGPAGAKFCGTPA
jgi:hypothetical protein